MSIVRLGAKAIDTTDPVLGQVLSSTDGVVLGRRNMIINGGMQVAQRGTSATSLSSGGYKTLDRFEYYVNAFDELRTTMSQDSSVPTGADSGFSKSLKLDCTTAESAIAADENLRIWQIIEAQDLARLGYGSSGAKSTTLSFYVKSSLTGTYAISFWCQDPNRNISKTYTISAANTWERKTVTIPGDTGGTGINVDNGEGMRINWFLNAGSNFTSTNTNNQWDTFASGRHAFGHTAAWGTNTSHDFFLTGVQFEVGESASDFEHRTFAEELTLCKRYFEIVFDASDTSAFDGSYYPWFALGHGYKVDQIHSVWYCTVEKRNHGGTVSFASSSGNYRYRNHSAQKTGNNLVAPSQTNTKRAFLAYLAGSQSGIGEQTGWALQCHSTDCKCTWDSEL